METFIQIIDFIIYAALGFALIEVYLKVNKIWKRKADKEVAESQSILGLSLSLFILVVWTAKYIIIGEYTSIIDNSIYLFETLIMLTISTGFFVGNNKNIGFFQLIKNAISLERKEATYLLNTLSGKSEALKVLEMLNQLAWIDENLDKKEELFIEEFANAWGIDFKLKHTNIDKSVSFTEKLKKLRTCMQDYLASYPKHEQVAQLMDLLQKMVDIDKSLSKEEDIIISELNALALHYLSGEKVATTFHVLIVPQSQQQTSIIRQIKPDAKELSIAGGVAFSLERFLSEKYAEEICEVYRSKGLFTIVKEMQGEL